MKLQAKIGDEITNLEIHRDGDNVTARVGDREYQLEVNDIDRGLYLFKTTAAFMKYSYQPALQMPPLR